MKTNFFFAALVAMLMSVFSLSAQEHPSVEQVARRLTDRMTKQLDLTPEQVSQIHLYHLERVRDAEARLADRTDRVEHPEQEMERSIEHVTDHMQMMLTGDQFEKWVQMQKACTCGKECCGDKECCKAGHKNCKGKATCGHGNWCGDKECCKTGHKNCKGHDGKMKKEHHGKK